MKAKALKKIMKTFGGLLLAGALAVTGLNIDGLGTIISNAEETATEETVAEELAADAYSEDDLLLAAMEKTGLQDMVYVTAEEAGLDESVAYTMVDGEVVLVDEEGTILAPFDNGIATYSESDVSYSFEGAAKRTSDYDKFAHNYIYNQLNDAEKTAWDTMYAICVSILESNDTISGTGYVSLEGCRSFLTNSNAKGFSQLFKYSNPQFYFIDNSWSGGYGSVALFLYDDFEDGTARRTATNAVFSKANEWIDSVSGLSSDYAKAIEFQNLICNKVTYDYDFAYGRDTDEQKKKTQCVYSVFVKDSTVCAGYAQSFAMLCNGAGIDAMAITGSKHAWVRAKLDDDNWYSIDPTWDDTDSSPAVVYYHFAKSADTIGDGTGHVPYDYWTSVLPPSTRSSTASTYSTGSLPASLGTCATPAITGTDSITITSSTAGATIYYTIDGATTPNSSYVRCYIYTGPISGVQKSKIRAIAVKDGYKDSFVGIGLCEAGTHTVSYVAAVSATCEAPGHIACYICSKCNGYFTDGAATNSISLDDAETPPLGHDFSTWKETTPATCRTRGEKTGYCSRCDTTTTEIVPANSNNHVNTKLYNVREASCSKEGYSGDLYCQDCYTYVYRGDTTPKTDHSYGDWYITKEPTMDSQGKKNRYCQVCYAIDEVAIPSKYESVKQFVGRLYTVCLERESDDAGLTYWADLLKSGQKTGIDVASGFIFSDEFKSHNYCNSCYVDHLYNAFMGRSADTDGKNYWLTELETGSTREAVFNGFATSTEFKNICNDYGITVGSKITEPKYGTVPTGKCAGCGEIDGVTAFVTRLYNVCLDRAPEQDGLNYWTNSLWNHSTSGYTCAYGFVFSQEFKNKGLNDSDFVEYMYKAFFGRASDEQGKAYWVGLLKNGTSREDVFDGFASSKEFDNLCKKYGIVRGQK